MERSVPVEIQDVMFAYVQSEQNSGALFLFQIAFSDQELDYNAAIRKQNCQ